MVLGHVNDVRKNDTSCLRPPPNKRTIPLSIVGHTINCGYGWYLVYDS